MALPVLFEVPAHGEARWNLNPFLDDGATNAHSLGHLCAGHEDTSFNLGIVLDPDTTRHNGLGDEGIHTYARLCPCIACRMVRLFSIVLIER